MSALLAAFAYPSRDTLRYLRLASPLLIAHEEQMAEFGQLESLAVDLYHDEEEGVFYHWRDITRALLSCTKTLRSIALVQREEESIVPPNDLFALPLTVVEFDLSEHQAAHKATEAVLNLLNETRCRPHIKLLRLGADAGFEAEDLRAIQEAAERDGGRVELVRWVDEED